MKKTIIILLIFLSIIIFSCNKGKEQTGEITYPYKVFVSIVPQKFFVEKVAGNKAEVLVMVKPGHSPATYEPLPKQMAKLSQSRAFFKIGVPFEKAWVNKIGKSNPDMKIIDTAKGIQKRHMDSFEMVTSDNHKHSDGHSHSHKKANDPHIWLSPKLVKKQGENIARGLISIDPANEEYYKNNLAKFKKSLDELHNKMKMHLSKVKNKRLMVFHPAYGYLADEFEFKQVPIEIEGKKPGAKELSKIIDYAKKNKINVIFIQKQFSTREAEEIAKAINGSVVRVNPLAYNYIENMMNIARKISSNLEKNE